VDDARLEQMLRDHVAIENCNPEGLGCPSELEIRRVVCNANPEDSAVREHLMACSACFGLYRGMLQEARAALRS
jgi:hypothetical protein